MRKVTIEPVSFGLVRVGGYAAVYLRVLRALEDEGLAKISAVIIRSPWKYPGRWSISGAGLQLFMTALRR
ncbi:MAG: hypothetical protein N3E47_06955 [Candidatus Bathyarchaeota archaeon]|nr:hypothetical protein [Candidatus Bathyarchaeota archaeon]